MSFPLRARGLSLALAASLLLCSVSATAAGAEDVPASLAPADIVRVDYTRGGAGFRPLFPDLPDDQARVLRLLELYSPAAAGLGPVESLITHPGGIRYLPQVRLRLAGGGSVTIVMGKAVSLFAASPAQSRPVTDPQAALGLREWAESAFVPARGFAIEPRYPRMGQQVTISSDLAEGAEAAILLYPSYYPVTIPSAPPPYPVPEAILLATVPVEHARYTYAFTLTDQMGRRPDGSPGGVGPGAWHLAAAADGVIGSPLVIRPADPPQPRAVVYDRGQLYAWDPAGGLRLGALADPADQPLLISESRWGSPVTHVSPGFLADWLDVPVFGVSDGAYRLGDAGMGLTVAPDQEHARVSGTMLQLGGRLDRIGGADRLPWTELGFFFDYRVQWLGPEQVAFLRGLDELPAAVSRALAQPVAARARRVPVTVAADGRLLDFGRLQPYLDPVRGRVMVPLRPTVAALGGQTNWLRLEPGWRENAAGHNYGLAPWGARVTSLADVTLGPRMWRLYQTPADEGEPYVPLRQLAVALGFAVTWDGAGARAELHGEK